MNLLTKSTIFDVLVAYAGAHPDLRNDFLFHWPDCVEFRFQGYLGFGGKIYYQHRPLKIWVSCYSEDLNDDTRAILDNVNERLLPKNVLYVGE